MKLVEERSELPIIEIFMFSRCRGRISQSLCYSGHRSQVEESEEEDPGSDIDRKKGGVKKRKKKDSSMDTTSKRSAEQATTNLGKKQKSYAGNFSYDYTGSSGE